MTTDGDANPADDPLPPHAFVPGGPWPHPTGSPRGHMAGRSHAPVAPIVAGDWARSPSFRRGIALFNAGYYWEAHEAWEGLWHAHGRQGPTADLIKGLIKLAAAGVKVRQGQRHGVVTHARRAAALFASVRDRVGRGRGHIGLDLDAWIDRAEGIVNEPPDDRGPPGVPVFIVFPFRIEPASGPDRDRDRDQAQAVAMGTCEAILRRQAAAPGMASTARTTAPTTPCEPPLTNP